MSLHHGNLQSLPRPQARLERHSISILPPLPFLLSPSPYIHLLSSPPPYLQCPPESDRVTECGCRERRRSPVHGAIGNGHVENSRTAVWENQNLSRQRRPALTTIPGQYMYIQSYRQRAKGRGFICNGCGREIWECLHFPL